MSNEQKQFQTAATNSNFGTSTHETGTVTFTGNPFQDLAVYGINLHGCTIRYRGKNNNGHTVTGRFNISGREETAGANSYEELILYIVRRYREYRRYVHQCRKQRRTRYRQRHPEYNFYHCEVTFM